MGFSSFLVVPQFQQMTDLLSSPDQRKQCALLHNGYDAAPVPPLFVQRSVLVRDDVHHVHAAFYQILPFVYEYLPVYDQLKKNYKHDIK